MEDTQNSRTDRATDSQRILLRSDWLAGSREKDYVSRNRKGAIQVTLPNESAYSEYFAGRPDFSDAEKTLMSARQIAQNIIAVTSDRPVTVKVGGATSFTDGNTVNIATDFFDDNGLTPGQKTDIFTGFAVHEAAHLNHSDFGSRAKLVKGMKPGTARLASAIQNIIEDERIEQITGETMPGMMDFVSQTKAHVFGGHIGRTEAAAGQDRTAGFVNAVVKMVRYPSALDDGEIDGFCDHLLRTRKALTPFPKTPAEVDRATKKILDIVKDFIKEDEQEKQQGQQSGANGQEGQDSSGQKNDPGQESHQGSQEQNNSQGQESGQGQGSGQKAGQEGENAESLTEKALSSNAMMKIMDSMEKMLAASDGTNTSPVAKINADIINGDAERDEGMTVRCARDNMNSYLSALKEIKRYIPAMRKALACRTMDRSTKLRGMDSGHLDTNKLVTMKMGNTSIFSRRTRTSCESVCICTLIDESGSMSGDRMYAARRTAILINEAVKTLDRIQAFTYGFGGDTINIYKENGNTGRYALGSTADSGRTPTAEAMKIAAKRVRRHTQDRCLMLIITDGMPASVQKVIETQNRITGQGFIPIGVDIADNPDMEGLFPKYVKATDLSSLPLDLGRLVKKTLYREMKTYTK